MKEILRPLGDKIVVRREEPDRASPGGILLPDAAKEKPSRGVVVAVGPGKREEGIAGTPPLCFNYPAGDDDAKAVADRNAKVYADNEGTSAIVMPRDPKGNWNSVEYIGQSLSVSVGDVVLFSAYAGNSVEIDGQELLIMREDDVLCVVEKSK